MAKKRGKRGENSYLNDFHPNLAGEYIYDGALYACQSDPDTQKKSRRRLWGCTTLLLLAALLSGQHPRTGDAELLLRHPAVSWRADRGGQRRVGRLQARTRLERRARICL